MPKIFKASNVIMNNNKINIITKENEPKPEIVREKKLESKVDMTDKISKILDQAKEEAQTIVETATFEAEKILNDARRKSILETKKLEQESESKGYDLGYQRAIKETNEIKEQAKEILEEANQQKKDTMENLEPQVVQLVLKIANRLLDYSVEFNEQLILILIKQGLNESTLTGEINIRVSQKNYNLVLENKDKILSKVDTSSKIEILKDLSMKESDCIIETPFGNIDCSLDEQFKSLKESMYLLMKND